MNLNKWNFRKFGIAATTAVTLALTIGTIQAAGAQLVTVVDAVELSPSNIFLPRTVNGMVSFRPCAGFCDKEYQRARLTADTQFFVGDRTVKFKDFQRDFANVRNSTTSYALISVDTKTITISSIRIEGQT